MAGLPSSSQGQRLPAPGVQQAWGRPVRKSAPAGLRLVPCGSPACLLALLRCWLHCWLSGSAGGTAPASLAVRAERACLDPVGLTGPGLLPGGQSASSEAFPGPFREPRLTVEELPVGSRGQSHPQGPHRRSRAQEDGAGYWSGPGSLPPLLALLSDT